MFTAADSIGTFVDYQKAFNHLDLNIIILKLKQMGVWVILVGWISYFLHERCQRVNIY